MTDAPIQNLRARAYRIPTDRPEADGTAAWSETILILVEVEAAGRTGLGYTYCDRAATGLITDTLAAVIMEQDAFDIPGLSLRLQQRVRNIGRPGLAACAISAIDAALWDLKGKLLDCPLARLLGCHRQAVPIYGSGGFTTYSDDELRLQLAGWVERDGCAAVKMKIGSHPAADPHRITIARSAIGDRQLFIDANGALSPRAALALVTSCAAAEISWFEEPVSADDLPAMQLLRQKFPPGIDLAAGEYIYTLDDARRLLEAAAVDVLQADATRCCGITGFLAIAALCDAYHIDLSGHCAPALHLHAACAAPRLRHLEWFHDHVRIEQRLFDGAPRPEGGSIVPDWSRPGLGLAFKFQDAAAFAMN